MRKGSKAPRIGKLEAIPGGVAYKTNPEALTTYDRILDVIKQDAVYRGQPIPQFETKTNKVHFVAVLEALQKVSDVMFASMPVDVMLWYKKAANSYNLCDALPVPDGYTKE